MRLVPTADVETLIAIFREALPADVLRFVASVSPATEAQIVSFARQRMVSHVKTAELRNQTLGSVYWFLHYGDLLRFGQRKYAIVPTYLVCKRTTSKRRILRISGDPRQDRRLFEHLHHLRVTFHTDTVRWRWESDEENAPFVGFQRQINADDSSMDDVLQVANQLRIRCIYVDELRDRLPNSNTLTAPSLKAYIRTPSEDGIWEEYDVTAHGLQRWHQVESWRTAQQELLRWRQNEEWYSKHNARYFHDRGIGQLAELGESAATLWTYHLDHQHHNERHVWLGEDVLWTPQSLPPAHQQWLQLLAERWHRDGEELYRFSLGDVDPKPVTDTLRKSLGVELIHAEPARYLR